MSTLSFNGLPVLACDEKPHWRLEDRFDREPMALLGRIAPGKFRIEFADQSAHVVGGPMNLFNIHGHPRFLRTQRIGPLG